MVVPFPVRVFRRNAKQSFSVQLSPSSGVVEILCRQVEVVSVQCDDGSKLLEGMLQRLGREEFGWCIGSFDGDYQSCSSCCWKAEVLELGQYSMQARGFVQCTLRFTYMTGGDDGAKQEEQQKQPTPASQKEEEAGSEGGIMVKKIHRKQQLKWWHRNNKSS